MSRAVPHAAVQLAREGIVLAGAGAAIALQVADPAVAAGVARQSNFTADPLGRLRRTLQYIFSVVLPEAAPARSTVTDWVARVHAPVAGVAGGTVYSAADPVTQRWVTATLYWTAEQVRWRMWGTSDAAEAEEIYQSYAVLGTALGMPAEAWHPDRTAFFAYWDARVADLVVSDAAREILVELFAARKAPGWLQAAMPAAKFLTAGLLPADLREQLGLAWDGAASQREYRLWRSLRAAYPRLPQAIRHAPSDIVIAGLPKSVTTRSIARSLRRVR